MRIVKNFLGSCAKKPSVQDPVTAESFRENVKQSRETWMSERKKHLPDQLDAQPPKTVGELSYCLQMLSQDAFVLAMIEWREGRDPRPHLSEIKSAWTMALAHRPQETRTNLEQCP